MKTIFLLSATIILSINISRAQECDIQIEILENRYMFGQATKLSSEKPVKKMKVDFNSEFMEVLMPVEGENYLIRVINQDCEAYCTRAKRVRQLHSEDEKLVLNLFKSKEEDIKAQIQACNM